MTRFALLQYDISVVTAGNVDFGCFTSCSSTKRQAQIAARQAERRCLLEKKNKSRAFFFLPCVTILVRYLSGSVVDSPERLPSHTENPAFSALQTVIIDRGHECIFSENFRSEKKKKN